LKASRLFNLSSCCVSSNFYQSSQHVEYLLDNALPSPSIRRPVTTLMFYTGVVLLGVIAFQNLAIDFFPTMKIPKLTVETCYLTYSASLELMTALGCISLQFF
jgi:hypothetical protein